MEWVYIAPSDEPTVYEAEPITTPEKDRKKLPFIFSSRLPVEEPVSEPDTESEFYGDEDVVEERVSPIKAFETFAGKNFPIGHNPDFSGSIYAEASDAVVKPSQKRTVKRPRQLPCSETRSQRLARLAAEVEALRAEYEDDDHDHAHEAFAQLSSLRDQLDKIEESISLRKLSARSNVRLLPKREQLDDNINENDTSGGISLQYVSPSVSALSALDRRVASLESSVGICDLEANCNGESLGSILEDVRTRIELVTDKNLPQKLKRDAQDIAGILQNELHGERGAEVLRAATALEKMEQWKHLAESVPIVVERLRSLKRVQEEAEHFSATMAALGSLVDCLQQRSEENSGLIKNVQTSLASNVATVQENLDIITKKVASIEAKNS